MARKLFGTSIALPAPFVAGSCDPVDARLVVENKADLTTNAADTFGTIGSDYCKVYEGIQVYVTSEKATYMFVGQSDANGVLLSSVQQEASWRKLSDESSSADDIQAELAKQKVKNTDGSISVSEAADGTTISVKLDSTDEVLTIGTGGVKANLNLTWDKGSGLKLVGKDGAEIATVPAADFIKDGMLESVTLEENPAEQTPGTYLHFTFNQDSGKEEIYLNVTDLIDIYTAGNGIDINEDNQVSLKLADDNEKEFLTLDANGLKLAGVRQAITTATQSLQPSIDKIEASVGLAEDGSHIKTSGNYTKDATTVVGEIAALDTQVKKNADVIAAEISRAEGVETNIQNELDKVETAAGLQNDGTYAVPTDTTYLNASTSLADADKKLDAQVKVNADAIAKEITDRTHADSNLQDAIDAEEARAQAEETRITNNVIGENLIPKGQTVMQVVNTNNQTAQDGIEDLATATGTLNGDSISYTAPTVSGVFSLTTSMMDMLKKIDANWNKFDCGEYE